MITTRALWVAANAARERFVRRQTEGPRHDPLEYETTAFWEDVFNHHLLFGFSNNSQQPPNDDSPNRCDIVTHYLDKDYHRKTLMFIEAKRANVSNEKNAPNKKTGLPALEEQVLGYCDEYLGARGSQEYVYACTVTGPYIRLFKVYRDKKPRSLEPIIPTNTTGINAYLNAFEDDDSVQIKLHFREIVNDALRNMDPDFASLVHCGLARSGGIADPSGSPVAHQALPKSSASASSSSKGSNSGLLLPGERPLQNSSPPKPGPSLKASEFEGSHESPKSSPSNVSSSRSSSVAASSDKELQTEPRLRDKRSESPRTPSRHDLEYRHRSPRQYESPQAQGSSSRRPKSPGDIRIEIANWGTGFDDTLFRVFLQDIEDPFPVKGNQFVETTVAGSDGKKNTIYRVETKSNGQTIRFQVNTLDIRKMDKALDAKRTEVPSWAK